MTYLADIAREYAADGLWVFPVRGKVPMTEEGFKDAVSLPAAAEALFLQHPSATGIGVDCGRSELLVVDLDGPAGEVSWLAIEDELDDEHETTEVTTGRGRHLWFHTRDPRSRNSASRLGGGIDTRGRGGYVLAPPSLHPSGIRYEWRGQAQTAAAPEWLLERLDPGPPPPVGEYRELQPGQSSTLYGRRALEGLADEMLAAQEGARNDTLLRVARRAGRLEAAGEISAATASLVITAAARHVGLSFDEIKLTYRNGFTFGQQYPTARRPR